MKKIKLLGLLLVMCLSVTAQVDTTRELQRNNTRGFAFKNIRGDSSMLFPTDTFPLKATWRGIAFKNGSPFYWNGARWNPLIIDTSGAFISSFYRIGDSVKYVKGGVHTFAFIDSVGGSTPTLQQVLTAGSTLTTDHTIDFGGNDFIFMGDSLVLKDTVGQERIIFETGSGSGGGTSSKIYLTNPEGTRMVIQSGDLYLETNSGWYVRNTLEYGNAALSVNTYSGQYAPIIEAVHNSEKILDISVDSFSFRPPLGVLTIDTINYTLSTTGKKILIRDTATGLVQNIDPSLLGASSYTFTNGLTESGGTVKLGGDLVNSTSINGKGSYSVTLDSLTGFTVKSPGLTKILTTSTQAYIYGNSSSTYMGVGTELFLAQQKSGNSISMSSDSFVLKMGGNSQLIIRPDSLNINPPLGIAIIDTLAAASNMTNKRVMTWDTVTKRWEQIAKDSVGGGGSSSLSSITAATATNTINNGNYKQEWQWDNLSSGYGLDLTSSTTSPASTVGLLNSTIDGANSNAGITSYAIIGQNYKTGTSSTNYGASFTASGGTTNIGARFTAAGGTNNYAITVPSSGGSVGIGTETPASKLHTVGTVRHATLGTASGDTTTNKPVGINSSGDIIPMTYWPGGGGSTSPAGNNRNIQFNSNGAFAGNDSLKFEGGFLKTSNNVPLQIGGVNVINYDNNTNVTTVGGSAYITTISSGGYTVFGTNSKGAIDHSNGALTLGANIGDSLFTNNGSSHQVGNARFDARVNVARASGYATNINGSLGANDFVTKKYVDSTRSLESTYTPSLTNTTNIAASTAYTTYYQRVGDVVHVWGEVEIDATTALTLTELGMELPIASNITNSLELAGTAAHEDNTVAQVKGDPTNDRAKFRLTPQTNTANVYSFHFSYKYVAP